MGWLSLIPPILAIALAMWKREVILALTAAILSAEILLAAFNPWLGFLASIDRIGAVFASPDNARILLFSLLIGALLALIRHAGGVSAFVRWLLRAGFARGPRSAAMLTSMLGVIIFIESYLSVLAVGTFGQSLFERFRLSRARLAFLADSTCSPVSVLILLNGWGAYVLGLLEGYGLENPVATMVASIPLNFYALAVLALVFYTAWSGRAHFALARHEREIAVQPPPENDAAAVGGKASYFLAPLFILVFGITGFMIYTGDGNLMAGSGAASVLYAIVLAICVVYVQLRVDGVSSHEELMGVSFKGMGELLPVVSILVLAFALGASMQAMQTGQFIAGMISDSIPLWLVAPVIFLAACLTSFTTGTSWGTFGILVPVAIPVALATGLPPALLLAAVLGGGVFGDHCSPISDSTILSSLASGCDHMVHVRTQLPYAMLAAVVALVLFAIAGVSG